MPRYSVNVYGTKAESVASDLMHTFKGWRVDYTGHPFFHVDNHSDLAEFQQKVDGMLPKGHKAKVRRIDE